MQKLKALKPIIVERYRLRSISLFGSYARDDQTETSDVDFVADFDMQNPAGSLLTRYTLEDMLTYYTQKFSDGAPFSVLKSMAFFDDAEEDPMPNMLKACTWSSVRQRIEQTVADAARTGF